ncbi:hypothetical protein AB0C02_25685 [Micromonospora sp. NPDC048999]|uniref:hypothetical protein n=1 Tax=Micromonospora sp. NPDC048999 TaxID=3155391 RepID=UPI0034023BD1
MVTGARRGIGLATVRAVMSRGAPVYVLDIHMPTDAPRGDQGPSWHEVDVADEQLVRSFFADHVKPGSLGGLVNSSRRDVSVLPSSAAPRLASDQLTTQLSARELGTT